MRVFAVTKKNGAVVGEAELGTRAEDGVRMMGSDQGIAIYEAEEFPPIGYAWDIHTKDLIKLEGSTLAQELELGKIAPSEAKARRIAEITTEIENKLYKVSEYGILYNDHRYQCREMDVNRAANEMVSRQYSADGAAPTPFWRDRDNIDVEHTDESFKALAISMGNYWKLCWKCRTLLKNDLSSMALDDMISYDIESRWNTKMATLV